MELKEEEIRPKVLFDEFLRLSLKDALDFFENSECEDIPCPACNNWGDFLYKKNGFSFKECRYCKTLYNSPRPLEKDFFNYYKNSPSSNYWATDFFRLTEESRREKLWKPKAKRIKDLLTQYCPDAKWICDIGGGYGVFAEEIQKFCDLELIIIEPSSALAHICREKKFNVIEDFFENIKRDNLPSGKGSFVSFELFEHLHDPRKFLNNCRNMLDKEGLLILTTLSGMGFDIQLLQENSKSVFPPHHLNFFNPKSLEILFDETGFTTVEISTPGKLDVDIVEKNISYIKDPFWKNFFNYADKKSKLLLQNLLSDSGFSSHMMAVVKPNYNL